MGIIHTHMPMKIPKYDLREKIELHQDKNIPKSCCFENTKENVLHVLEFWEWYKQNMMKVIFLDTKSGRAWAIFPKSHDKICEESKRKKSMISLYQNSLN